MSGNIVLKNLLKLKGAVIDRIREEEGKTVVECHVHRSFNGRCPYCNQKRPHYDNGRGLRRWKHVPYQGSKVMVEAPIERVKCPEHGIVTTSFPWAHHKSRFTEAMEEAIAASCKSASMKSTAEANHISENTVLPVVRRVIARKDIKGDKRFDGLIFIGVDETSRTKGHHYVTIVVNHLTGEIIWVGEGFGKEVLEKFLKSLTPEQRASIQVVSGDGALWIQQCIDEYLPNAVKAMDPFHVVSWCTTALDNVRKEECSKVRREISKLEKELKALKKKPAKKNIRRAEELATARRIIKGRIRYLESEIQSAKYPLLKNPENLTLNQKIKLEYIKSRFPMLNETYRLKEKLRSIFKADPDEGKAILDEWITEAERSGINEFFELAQKIRRNYDGIVTALETRITNARIESVNNKIKLTIRIAYGFRKVEDLILIITLRYFGIDIHSRRDTKKDSCAQAA